MWWCLFVVGKEWKHCQPLRDESDSCDVFYIYHYNPDVKTVKVQKTKRMSFHLLIVIQCSHGNRTSYGILFNPVTPCFQVQSINALELMLMVIPHFFHKWKVVFKRGKPQVPVYSSASLWVCSPPVCTAHHWVLAWSRAWKPQGFLSVKGATSALYNVFIKLASNQATASMLQFVGCIWLPSLRRRWLLWASYR